MSYVHVHIYIQDTVHRVAPTLAVHHDIVIVGTVLSISNGLRVCTLGDVSN